MDFISLRHIGPVIYLVIQNYARKSQWEAHTKEKLHQDWEANWEPLDS